MIFEPLINMHKIKYEILNDLVRKNLKHGRHLNIYINLDTIFKHFFSEKVMGDINNMKGFEPMEMSGALINMIAHYRDFFWRYWNIPTSFYLYLANRKPVINDQFYDGYMKDFIKKRKVKHPEFGPLNEVINDNMKLANIISLYVKDAYCLPGNGLEPTLGPYHIMNKVRDNIDICHLILTKDENDFQLLNAAENAHVLRLKYDKSYMINRDTIYMERFKKIKYRPEEHISSELYPVLLAFSGLKSRSIDPIKGYGFVKVMKKLDQAIQEGMLPNSYISDMMTLCHVLDVPELYPEISNRFKAIDLKTGYQMLGTGAIETIESMLIDRYDNASIMGLNDEYYRNNPLRLIELCRGVGY